MKIIFCLSVYFFGGIVSAVSQANTNVNQEDGLAIDGFDPVAYFIEEKAFRGKDEVTSTYQGVKYYFISSKNKALFDESPGKFLPQYGGWCAYAMADGEKIKVDPETFKIIDGKLYLFYNFYFNNTLTKWNRDEVNLKSKADQHWNRLSR